MAGKTLHMAVGGQKHIIEVLEARRIHQSPSILSCIARRVPRCRLHTISLNVPAGQRLWPSAGNTMPDMLARTMTVWLAMQKAAGRSEKGGEASQYKKRASLQSGFET